MYECVFCTVQYLLVVVMYLEFLCNVGVVYFLFVYVLAGDLLGSYRGCQCCLLLMLEIVYPSCLSVV